MADAEQLKVYSLADKAYIQTERVVKTDAEWRQQLTPERFAVLRKHGTERAFSGALWEHKQPGVYRCAGCGLDLYSSTSKYDSGSGWPSFYQPVAAENVATHEDRSLIMPRTELVCSRCGGHLGHVFNDGPQPTGKRHCINSLSLEFVAQEN